jgi:hypothetical protein
MRVPVKEVVLGLSVLFAARASAQESKPALDMDRPASELIQEIREKAGLGPSEYSQPSYQEKFDMPLAQERVVLRSDSTLKSAYNFNAFRHTFNIAFAKIGVDDPKEKQLLEAQISKADKKYKKEIVRIEKAREKGVLSDTAYQERIDAAERTFEIRVGIKGP